MSVFTNLEKIKDALLSRKCKSPIKDSKLWESKTDKLPNSQLYTLKSAAKNMTLISLKITKNTFKMKNYLIIIHNKTKK